MTRTPNSLPDVYCSPARLNRVIDGDTVVLDLDIGYDRRQLRWHVRLLDVDTAETWGTRHSNPEEYALGLTHTRFTGQWLAEAHHEYEGDDEFPLVFDSQEWQRDGFRRSLGYVYRRIDGKELTQALLEEFGEDVRYTR